MPPEIHYELEGLRVVYPLDKDEVTIGRSTSNDLVIQHITVSRRHAKVFREGELWKVADLGSTYGTRVNDLGHADTPLHDGDRIFLHRFPLTFIDKSSPGASLTTSGERREENSVGAVYQSAVDFSMLASIPADVNHLQRLLTIMTKSSEAILVSRSLTETYRRVLDLIFEHLPVQRGFIMLWDEARGDFVTPAFKHQSGLPGESARIQFSRTIAEKVYREKMAVLTTDALSDVRFQDGRSIQALGIRSAMAAPLWKGERVDGLIYVDTPLQRKAFDNFDLDILSAIGNQLAVAIEQSRLQDNVVRQQVIRRRLERYHSPAVIERIAASSESTSGEFALMAEERDVTVLFADVVGFTHRCESMEPHGVVDLLNRYFSEMTDVVFRHEGTLDKFIGDCLMAVFGAPLPAADHAQRAVETALEMREELDELNEPLSPEARVRFRVGIHSGKVVAGDIGSVRRSDYTVLGATVNLASRLESAVARPGQIVISEQTRACLGDRYVTRALGEHELKGFRRPILCHEVIGHVEAATHD